MFSGAQRLANGNTLICEGGEGRLLEVTTDGDIVWEYVNPTTLDGPLLQGEPVPVFADLPEGMIHQNMLFRATRIPADHPGLARLLDDPPTGVRPIERYSD